MITANDAREMVKANDIMPKLERRIEKAAKSCHASTNVWIPKGVQDSIISRLTENGFNVTVIDHMVDCDNEIEICISWEEETPENETMTIGDLIDNNSKTFEKFVDHTTKKYYNKSSEEE